eukprot:TRINITY_DN7206_c0_g3_i1.p1 TRINITY_DN7206_c0_g3~~TRINITY_DN7206_c0_g3_i1.p1  ORF type:complete len:189 (-),score=53.91 TRINITY_DN7206_c0_g3_i1:81-647(-)
MHVHSTDGKEYCGLTIDSAKNLSTLRIAEEGTIDLTSMNDLYGILLAICSKESKELTMQFAVIKDVSVEICKSTVAIGYLVEGKKLLGEMLKSRSGKFVVAGCGIINTRNSVEAEEELKEAEQKLDFEGLIAEVDKTGERWERMLDRIYEDFSGCDKTLKEVIDLSIKKSMCDKKLKDIDKKISEPHA